MSRRIAFFDRLASNWDEMAYTPEVQAKMKKGLEAFEISKTETIIDIGCGTGNLSAMLLAHLSPEGRIIALDFSREMIEKARAKVPDTRVHWLLEDVTSLQLPPESADRIICFSVWPHFNDGRKVAGILSNILRKGGLLHIWHVDSRATINEIHKNADPSVANDILPPAYEVTQILEGENLSVLQVIDDAEQYLISAVRG